MKTPAAYTVVATNAAGAATSQGAVLNFTAGAASDADGVPDPFEHAHGMNRFDPADSSLDADQDRQHRARLVED